MDENTPSWIRDLYQDIYPNIVNPSQGRRIPWGGANGPMVSAFRQRAATAPKTPPMRGNVNPTNPWQTTVTREPPPNTNQGFDESGFISNLPNLQPPEPNPSELNLGQFQETQQPWLSFSTDLPSAISRLFGRAPPPAAANPTDQRPRARQVPVNNFTDNTPPNNPWGTTIIPEGVDRSRLGNREVSGAQQVDEIGFNDILGVIGNNTPPPTSTPPRPDMMSNLLSRRVGRPIEDIRSIIQELINSGQISMNDYRHGNRATNNRILDTAMRHIDLAPINR